MTASIHHEHRARGNDEEMRGPSNRAFGAVFTVVFSLAAAYLAIVGRIEWAVALAACSVLTLSVAMFAPRVLTPANWAWTHFGLLLHRIVNPIVLGGIFFVVITPIAIALTLFGRDALKRRLEPRARSYWVRRTPPGPEPASMRNQF